MPDAPADYDLEAVYDAEFSPLVARLIELSKRHGIPMLASFAYAHDADGYNLCTTYIPVEGRGVECLSDAARGIHRGEWPGPSAIALSITRRPEPGSPPPAAA